MSENFDFGLGDIAEENDSGHTLARGAAAFLIVLFLALSCLATYMFFSTYAPGLGDWAGPAAAPIAAGLMGFLCLDVACIIWGFIRTKAATSAAQMAIALVISIVDLLLGLLSSGLYIILSTTFETGVRDAAGALTEFGQMVNYVGIGVITLALVGNFASVFAWLMMGADAKAAQLKTELRAIVAAGQHRVNKARAKRVVNRTVAEIERQLPEAADNVAAEKSAEYMTANMERGNGRKAGKGDGAALDRLEKLLEALTALNGNGVNGDGANPTKGGQP